MPTTLQGCWRRGLKRRLPFGDLSPSLAFALLLLKNAFGDPKRSARPKRWARRLSEGLFLPRLPPRRRAPASPPPKGWSAPKGPSRAWAGKTSPPPLLSLCPGWAGLARPSARGFCGGWSSLLLRPPLVVATRLPFFGFFSFLPSSSSSSPALAAAASGLAAFSHSLSRRARKASVGLLRQTRGAKEREGVKGRRRERERG